MQNRVPARVFFSLSSFLVYLIRGNGQFWALKYQKNISRSWQRSILLSLPNHGFVSLVIIFHGRFIFRSLGLFLNVFIHVLVNHSVSTIFREDDERNLFLLNL